MGLTSDLQHDLTILEKIEQNPDSTQASLADQLGVAVGTINWHIKRLIDKGYVKVRRAERRKLRYIITPEGIALRARLTVDYIQTSFHMYRLVRERALESLSEVRRTGWDRVRVQGDGDVAEVVRLTCLEQGFTLQDDESIPELKIEGLKVILVKS